MFATRDQENLVHGHQQLAAAKPLNHGINRLAPKTPNNGLKSSYGGLMTGKIRGGDDENVVFGGKKGGNVEKHAFQTPMAPRERAPLGARTTNVRAAAFQTPGPLKDPKGQKLQPRSTSARKPKLKIHQSTQPVVVEPAVEQEAEYEEVPDIEYCPPPPQDLPDLPDDMDWRHKEFPELAPDVLLPAIWQHHYNPTGEDGMTRLERQQHELNKRMDARIDAQLDKIVKEAFERPARLDVLLQDEPLATLPSGRAKKTKHVLASQTAAAPTTLDSRIAAKALAAKSSAPRFAAPTAATKARTKAAVTTAQPSPTQPRHSPPPPSASASRSTVGYAKGRRISSGIRQISGNMQRLDMSTAPEKRTSHLKAMFVPSNNADADENGRDHQKLFGPNDDDVLFDEAAMTDFVLKLPLPVGEAEAVAERP